MQYFLSCSMAALVALGCGGATTDDPAGGKGAQPSPAQNVAAGTNPGCAKYDVVNEPCRVLEATPDLASQVHALGLAFQTLAAGRQAMRIACQAVAGKLGVSAEDALLKPDIAAPVCEVAAQALRAESKTFTITARAPACVDAQHDLCRKGETFATSRCVSEDEGAAEDPNRPDLVERLSPSVAQFVAASRATSQNAARLVELGSKLESGVSTDPPASCAATLMASYFAESKLIIEDAVRADAALRR